MKITWVTIKTYKNRVLHWSYVRKEMQAKTEKHI